MKRTFGETRRRHERANRECAEIILRDLAKYGEGSLPVVWARLVLSGEQREGEGLEAFSDAA